MIKPIKDKRRARAAKKKGILTPKPEWVEAFLILLLRKSCNRLMCHLREPSLSKDPTLTVKISDLEKFVLLKANNRTSISFDPENQTVTLKAPEIKIPEMKIVVPKKRKIITN